MSEKALTLRIESESTQATEALNALISSLHRVQNAVKKGFDIGNAGKQLQQFTHALNSGISDKGISRIERLAAAVQQLSKLGDVKIPTVSGGGFGTGNFADSLNDAKESAREATDQIEKAAEAMESIKPSAEHGSKGASELTKNLKSLFRVAGSGNAPLSSLLSSFIRIAKFRLIRTAIKEIAEGFKFGLSNVYEYSKAVGTSYYQAVDTATNATFKMKNSLGAALAPALQALVPLFQTVVSWIITLANYVNQFIALLTGKSSWTRATDAPASTMDKIKTKTAGARKEIQHLLADWDELNIIQSKTNNGGGGGGTTVTPPDYSKMFEEVYKFDETIQRIVDNIKKIISFIKDNIDLVLDIAKRIGAVILAWTIGEALGGFIGALLGLVATGVWISVVFDVVSLFDNKYLETSDPGWLVASVAATLLGAAIAGKIATSLINAQAGYIAMSLTFAVSAVADLLALIGAKDVSALSKESILLAIKSALSLGAGIFIFSNKIAGLSVGRSIATGLGAAAIWLGVTVGVKAVVETYDAGEVTEDTVKAGIISALSTGLGVTAVASAVGAGAGTAIALGAGSILATGLLFGAAVAVAMELHTEKKNIHWGKKVLTHKQVQEFVNGELFSVDVETTANLIKTTVTASEETKLKLRNSVSKAIGTFNVIKLGVASQQDYATMKTDVDGIIEQIGTYVQQAKNEGKLTISYTPTLVGGSGSDVSSWFSTYTTGWDVVYDFAQNTGTRIGELLTTAEGQKIIASKPEILNDLMQQLTDVTNAIAEAEVTSKAAAKLKINLGDLTEASAEDVIKTFAEYKQILTDEYTKLITDQYTKQGELVAALLKTAGEDDPVYKQALADYEKMGENLAKAVTDGVDSASAQGVKAIKEWIVKVFGDSIKSVDFKEEFGDLNLATALEGIFEGDKEALAKALIQSVVEEGGVDVSIIDLVGITGWDLISDEAKKQLYQALANAFGADEAKSVLEKVTGTKISDAIADVVKDAAQTATDSAGETVDTTKAATDVAENLYDSIEKAIDAYDPNENGDAFSYFNENVYGAIIEALKKGDISDEDAQAVAQSIFDQWHEALQNGDYTTLGADIVEDLRNFIEFPAMGDNKLMEGLKQTASNVHNYITDIKNSFSEIDGLSFSLSADSDGMGGTIKVNFPSLRMAAEGGMFTTGQMFIAREAGPEMVGNIGNRTSVANNDQIVAGIAGGVAAGQEEQNSLLRQQNDYLRRILAKESTVKVEPSAGWGKFNRRSEEMYARNTGR